MAWLVGLIVGAVIGGAIWGWRGAVTLGFLGWLVGVIMGSRRKGPSKPSSVPARVQVDTPTARIEKLERAVAALEERLARLEGPAPAAPVVTTPEVVEELIVAAETSAVEQAAEIPPPPIPPAPEKPNFIVAWFMGGNTIVRVGAVILFFGLIFLLNYARERGLIAPELRVAGVAAFGIVLLVLGWRLREKRTGYAVSLQGAGIATLYLTIFAAMRLYHLIPPEAAFFLLAAMAAFSAILAVGQDSLALAVIGAGGGFLAPILASTGSGNHVALFSYYLVLNLGILGIAWFKAWRSLNIVAFAFTFLIGLAWGTRYYRDELFGTTEPFLITFFLLYVAIAILFARASPAGSARSPSAYIDGTIVFGNPLAAFGLQAGMLSDTEFGLAYSALGAAVLYIVLATVLHKRRSERWALLAETFLALGVVFATLAIPLALDARWTSAAWALEGAAILWVGLKQERKLARAFGLLLELGAGVSCMIAYWDVDAEVPIANAPFVGAMLVAFAGLWSNWLLGVAKERVTAVERFLTPFLFVWGIAWFFLAGFHDITTFLAREVLLSAEVAFFSATALAFAYLGRRIDWREAFWPGLALMPVLALWLLFVLMEESHPFAHYGWLAWPFAIAAQLGILWLADAHDGQAGERPYLHIGTFLVACALGAAELHWFMAEQTARHSAWSVASVLVVPGALLLLASSRWAADRWPLTKHLRAYRYGASVTVLAAMAFWILYANVTHDGRSDPLPYLPLLNAIDLGHFFIAICAVFVVLGLRRAEMEPPALLRGQNLWVVTGALAFVWLNAILLRSIHHWADVPYRLAPMMRSVVAQASISIFWSVIALTLMVYATRTARRNLWMTGAALMGVVVVKLFLVDLSHIGGIERIVSFIAVGLLMLVIGYFSPVPPRRSGEPS